VTSVTKGRPVTGFCERCARANSLLIPVPGSGDLDFERIPARFSWCAGCDRIVGRTCCWDGAAGLCPDCAALRAAQESSLTDAVLARNALSGLSAATDAATALGARLGQLTASDDDQARNGWEDAWLETGIAIVRADHATETARRRGAEASATAADEEWLARELASRGGAWHDRRQEVADRLEQVGLRVRALGAVALPAAPPMATPAESRLVAVPMTRADSPITQQPVREPPSVGARPTEVEPPSRTLEPGGPARAVRPPGRRTTSPELGRPAQSVAPSALHVLARPDASPPAPTTSPPSTRPIPLRPRRPVSRDLPAGRVVLALRSLETNGAEPPVRDRARRSTPANSVRAMAVAPSPALRPAGAPRVSRRAVILLAALLTVIGAVVLVLAAMDRLGGTAERASGGLAGGPSARESAVAGAGTTATPTAGATTAGTGPGITAPVVTFDREPLGPLQGEATAIARVVGAPEVAAMPTSFDRSLLLAVEGAGACLVGVPSEPTRSLAIDLHTGTRVDGTLRVTPTDRPDETAALVLSRIPGLAPNTWYSMQLGWTGGDAISFDIRERDGGRAVQRGALVAEAGFEIGSGSVCITGLGVSEATAMHVDNVVVGS
jgi:hypothetical protein